ncbi:hypothetical protein PTNB73_10139 [Pyrenophora teres f. teres]|nr:hypothetical protein HRS9122_00089 [Pyrenophora teres f. teres]KAE8855482.1 hypothetical protein PTNB73_10139 [Pyrenophora teres f. teres]
MDTGHAALLDPIRTRHAQLEDLEARRWENEYGMAPKEVQGGLEGGLAKVNFKTRGLLDGFIATVLRGHVPDSGVYSAKEFISYPSISSSTSEANTEGAVGEAESRSER